MWRGSDLRDPTWSLTTWIMTMVLRLLWHYRFIGAGGIVETNASWTHTH